MTSHGPARVSLARPAMMGHQRAWILGAVAVGLLLLLWWSRRSARLRPGQTITADNIHPADGVSTATVGRAGAVYNARVPLTAGQLQVVTVGVKHYGEGPCTIEYRLGDRVGRLAVPVGPRVALRGMRWPVGNGDVLRVQVCADEGDRIDLSRGQVVVEAQVG